MLLSVRNDIVLENKAVREENAYKVLQMMHENKVFDFGFNFEGTGYNLLKEVVVDNDAANALLAGPPVRKGWEEFEKL